MPRAADKVQFSVWLSKTERDEFRQACSAGAVNSSELVRQWIRAYIEEHAAAKRGQ